MYTTAEATLLFPVVLSSTRAALTRSFGGLALPEGPPGTSYSRRRRLLGSEVSASDYLRCAAFRSAPSLWRAGTETACLNQVGLARELLSTMLLQARPTLRQVRYARGTLALTANPDQVWEAITDFLGEPIALARAIVDADPWAPFIPWSIRFALEDSHGSNASNDRSRLKFTDVPLEELTLSIPDVQERLEEVLADGGPLRPALDDDQLTGLNLYLRDALNDRQPQVGTRLSRGAVEELVDAYFQSMVQCALHDQGASNGWGRPRLPRGVANQIQERFGLTPRQERGLRTLFADSLREWGARWRSG